jgi:predicted PurR-regulated permease PerM
VGDQTTETAEATEAAMLDRSTRTIIIAAVRIVSLGFLGYWSLVLVGPFLTIIVWSVILAVALYPVFTWLVAWVRFPALAAAAITIAGLVVILGPVTWLGLSLVDNLGTLIERFGDGSWAIPPPPEAVKAWPVIGEKAYEIWYEASTNLKALLVATAPELKPIASTALTIVGNAGLNLLKFLIATVIAGFLFIPGPALVEKAKSIVRLVATDRGEEFVALAGATIRNVSRGVIGISILQSLLAGIGLLVAGIPAAGLISFLVLFLGIIQVGPSIVLLPLIAWELFQHGTAAGLFAVYMFLVNWVDNALRPWVMAKGLSTPMLVILVGVLGGTLAHGILGLFVGPIVLSIAWQLLAAWMQDGVGRIGAAGQPPLLDRPPTP